MTIQSLIELLTPSQCLACGREAELLCPVCLGLVALKAQVCFRCNSLSNSGRTCQACRRRTRLAGVSVAAYYEGPVKEMILQLKFHRARSAGRLAAGLVLAAMPETLQVDVVTNVPVSASRYRERGYNQSELIAKRVARVMGVPFQQLMSRQGSAHQLGTDRRTRFEQVAGAFFAVRSVEGRRVLVVDDVVTTGATLSECAAILSIAGAAQVWGAAVARH
jgi:competence protein ComFC